MQEAYILKTKIDSLLDTRRYNDALRELDRQSEIFVNEKKNNLFLLAEIAGSFISLGSESYNLEAVNKGLSIFQKNREILMTAITEDSIDYCLGNGFEAIFKISIQQKDNFFPNPESVKGPLFDAKQYFLKAFKKIDLDNLNDFSIQVLSNLGNNLNHSGRIVEALQLFDMVLKHNPEFPQAVISKAGGLRYMIQNTNCQLTISLISEIYRLFNIIGDEEIVPKEIKENVELGKMMSIQFLVTNNVNLDRIEDEFILNQKEYENHPENLKFFLDNFLSLSEHSLYCKCNGAKIDNLAIGFPGFTTNDLKVIQLELLNNRLKSEFSFSRQLYFDFLKNSLNENVQYENVINGIVDGINFEQLRTSFKKCFGILDKISEGICFLFDLDKKEGENIYFETFWNSKQSPNRWFQINQLKNIHLTALYSIACDLNKQNGEFGFYKVWRNKLEHGLFSLTNSDYIAKGIESKIFSENTSSENFENKTKLLLQLTRSAIFSFVFCARQELITNKENGNC